MWIPHFLSFLQRFGWRLSPAGDGIVRTDENQCVRTFVIGVDRLCVLREWLVEHLQNLALKQCERDVRSLHRRGPDSAVFRKNYVHHTKTSFIKVMD